MKYRTRHAESRLRLLSDHFKVVLVTGARQVGKTTLLTQMFPEYRHVVFDPVQDLFDARRDPDLFLANFPPPLILDEVQYVPELLAALKRRVDRSEEMGRYILTGSQNLGVLKSVAESLAGRVGIIDLEPMGLGELNATTTRTSWLSQVLDNPDDMPGLVPPLDSPPLVRTIWRGGLPGLLDHPDTIVPDYHQSYVRTYVERDILAAQAVSRVEAFDRFLGLSAALTAQEINASQLGRDVGIDPSTARQWLDLLSMTYQWRELPAYHGNAVKRVSGKKKGYLTDTGVACWLQRISSPEALAVSPLLGSLFETWVVNEVFRQLTLVDMAPRVWHWRSTGGGEVDLLLERNGRFHPIEVKAGTNLSSHATRGFRAFRETYPNLDIATGVIVYAGRDCYRVNELAVAVPWPAMTGIAPEGKTTP